MDTTALTQEVVNAAAQVPEAAGEKLLYGLKVSFIGLSTVFLVLILIMIVLYLFKFIFYTIPNKKKAEAAANAVAQAPVPAPAAPAVEEVQDDGEEIAAAIAAAIAVYMQDNHPGTKYRIRSFKRI